MAGEDYRNNNKKKTKSKERERERERALRGRITMGWIIKE